MTPPPRLHTAVLFGLLVLGGLRAQEDVPDVAKRVRSLVAKWAERHSPGVAVGVLRDGKPLVIVADGVADVAAGVAVTPDTPFYVASVAKPVTAFCAMHAHREGALDLDASIRSVFPELPEAYGEATLRHAVHHTSGVPDLYDAAIALNVPFADMTANNERAFAFLRQLDTRNFAPGTRFLYCNSGYLLLAEAVARSSKTAFADYVGRHVFERFGMKTASCGNLEESAGVAVRYSGSPGKWRARKSRAGLAGPGGMVASVRDLAAFAQGIETLEGTPMGDDLLRVGGPGNPALGDYAAGWFIQRHRGRRVVRHFGGGFGAGADIARFPESGVTIVTLLNTDSSNPQELTAAVADIVFSGASDAAVARGPKPVELSAAERRRFPRFWREQGTGLLWVLLSKGSRYQLAGLGDFKVQLVPTAPDRLEAVEAQVAVTAHRDQDVMRLEVAGWAPLMLEPLPFPPKERPDLAAYAGSYSSPSSKGDVRFEVVSGRGLRLVQGDSPIRLPPFQPIGRDLFLCDKGAMLAFRRDRDGRISGATIHANRAWNLELSRVEDR